MQEISVVEWGRFLELWSVDDLDSAARMLRVSSVQDLAADERELLRLLRDKFSHLLFLNRDDPFELYQKQLRRLNDLGILNLNITPVVYDRISELEAKNRSLTCRVREANKKSVKMQRELDAKQQQVYKYCHTHIVFLFVGTHTRVRTHTGGGSRRAVTKSKRSSRSMPRSTP